MSCAAANKISEENYLDLNITQLGEQSLEAMNNSTVNNTVFFIGAEAFIAKYWTQNSEFNKQSSGIKLLWDAYPEKRAWRTNKAYTIKPINDVLFYDN